MSQFHDFDAAWAEEDDNPYVLHNLLGRDWECKRPSEVPASLLLRLDRLLLVVATEDVPDDLVVDDSLSSESILRQLAGDDNVDAWLTGVEQPDGSVKRLPYPRLMEVSRHLMAVYRGQDPEGEAPAANRSQRRAAAKAKKKRSGSATS